MDNILSNIGKGQAGEFLYPIELMLKWVFID